MRLGRPAGAHGDRLLAGASARYAVGLKYKFGFDDSLDVVGVHLVGGLAGTLLIGLFASPEAMTTVADSENPALAHAPGVAGLFYGGGLDQLGKQAIGAFSVMAYSAIVTFIIAMIIKHTIGWRISTSDEISGIDLIEHSEAGYDLSPVYYSNKVQRTLFLTRRHARTNEQTSSELVTDHSAPKCWSRS